MFAYCSCVISFGICLFTNYVYREAGARYFRHPPGSLFNSLLNSCIFIHILDSYVIILRTVKHILFNYVILVDSFFILEPMRSSGFFRRRPWIRACKLTGAVRRNNTNNTCCSKASVGHGERQAEHES